MKLDPTVFFLFLSVIPLKQLHGQSLYFTMNLSQKSYIEMHHTHNFHFLSTVKLIKQGGNLRH